MNMKILLILSILFVSYISFTQDFKQKDEFKSKIDSCYINSLRFSHFSGFYIKSDSTKYYSPTESEYIWEIHEEYHLGATFQIDSLKVEIKRIKENYWYYSEKLDTTYLIKGFFSIDNSNYEIPVCNYDFEVYKEPYDIKDETRYFDTLNFILKQGDWRETINEFDNIEHYKNNMKDGEFILYNTKYSSILLSINFFKDDNLIKDSLIEKTSISNNDYFLGHWEKRYNSYSSHNYITFIKTSNPHIWFDPKYFHYNIGCRVGRSKPTDYKWKYDKNESTLLLDTRLYKIIDNSEDWFVLVKIETYE